MQDTNTPTYVLFLSGSDGENRHAIDLQGLSPEEQVWLKQNEDHDDGFSHPEYQEFDFSVLSLSKYKPTISPKANKDSVTEYEGSVYFFLHLCPDSSYLVVYFDPQEFHPATREFEAFALASADEKRHLVCKLQNEGWHCNENTRRETSFYRVEGRNRWGHLRGPQVSIFTLQHVPTEEEQDEFGKDNEDVADAVSCWTSVAQILSRK